MVQVKALACELPAESGVPLSRWSAPELVVEAVARGVVESISASTVRRWLAGDVLKPWQYRTWIYPRDPDFATKAARALDLYAGVWDGEPLTDHDFVICADEKTSIQARCRCHPTLPPGKARMMRVEHEYDRTGALAYLAAYDVHHARVIGRLEPTTGIEPFGRLAAQVMTSSPTPAPIGCSGWSTTAPRTAGRPRSSGWRRPGRTPGWCTCRYTRPGWTRSRSTSPSCSAKC